MRIAYFGGDWFSGCLGVWQDNGHEITHLFTDGEQPYNERIRTWARSENLTHFSEQPDSATMQQLINDQVDLLFSVEYPWKIPCHGMPFKTVNVHPSLLPHGRGPNPISWSLLKYPQHAGVSLHKLASEFDKGDIIYQKAISISEFDFDSYLAHLEQEIPQMLQHVCEQFDELYQAATPQSDGSYWPKLTLNDRKLNWQMSVTEINNIIRATGKFGVVTIIEDKIYLVRDVKCQVGETLYPPGTLFQEDEKYYYIAVNKGQCIVPKSGILETAQLDN